MKIIAYKDLILAYIRQDYSNDEYKALVEKIFYNENSIFLYSKRFIHFLESEIDQSERSRELVRFNAFITKIRTSNADKRPNIKTSESSQNIDEELKAIFDATKDNVVVTIAYNQPSQEIKNAIPNIAVLSQQQKPNYHWLVVNLAILHPNKLTLRCFEFSSNNEVTQLFKDFFHIPKNVAKVVIFDTQCNLNHDKFDYILNNNIKVSYFTKYSSREKNQYDRRNDIKGNFGNSASVFLLKRGRKAHGRRIVFENLIITLEEDFWNLQISESDWNIDIEYSEDVAANWLNRCEQYERFN